MSHSGQVRKMAGQKGFTGQSIFLRDILLEDFLGKYPTLLDWLRKNDFLTYANNFIKNIKKPISKTKQEKFNGLITDK